MARGRPIKKVKNRCEVCNLKQFRIFRGILQKEVAAAIGIHEETYRNIENTPLLPPPGLRQKIADYLGAEETYLWPELEVSNKWIKKLQNL